MDEEIGWVRGLSLATEVSEGGRGGGDTSGERAKLAGRILAGLGDPELAAAVLFGNSSQHPQVVEKQSK